MPQTNGYEMYPDKAIAGLIADSSGRVINTNAAAAPTRDIEFGRVVVFAGTSGELCKTPVGIGAEVLAGITVATAKGPTLNAEGTQGIDGYADGQAVNTMSRGRVWCLIDEESEALAVGDSIYAVGSDASPERAGLITSVDTATLAVTSARVLTPGVAGELVIVEINLP